MRRRLARGVLSLYPLAFRRRYEAEMRELIDELPVNQARPFDLARGAFLAHVRLPAGLEEAVGVGDRQRASLTGILACWLAIVGAGIAFQKTTEDQVYSRAGDAHALIGLSHSLVVVLAAIGSLAVLAGAAVLSRRFWHAAREDEHLWQYLRSPAIALTWFGVVSGTLVWFANSSSIGHGAAAGWAGIGIWVLSAGALGAVSVIACRRILARIVSLGPGLVLSLRLGGVATGAMGGVSICVAVYLVALLTQAQLVADIPTGPAGGVSTTFALACQLLVMLAATGLALVAARRGLRAAP